MDAVLDDRFVVFLRVEQTDSERRACVEWPVKDCSSYQEARQVKQFYQDAGRECVIRFVGVSGGGD